MILIALHYFGLPRLGKLLKDKAWYNTEKGKAWTFFLLLASVMLFIPISVTIFMWGQTRAGFACSVKIYLISMTTLKFFVYLFGPVIHEEILEDERKKHDSTIDLCSFRL